MPVKVKICGITRIKDALAAIAMGADMIGLNFYAQSSRYLDLAQAREIARTAAGRVALVGVFVNSTRGYIEERRRECGLDFLQFCGDETEPDISGWPAPVIRTMRLRPGGRFEIGNAGSAEFILLDSLQQGSYGGTGKPRPLDDLRGCDLSRVFIAGGLRPETVAAVSALNPYAVDVASGIESAPGVKDHDKMRSFIVNAKSSR